MRVRERVGICWVGAGKTNGSAWSTWACAGVIKWAGFGKSAQVRSFSLFSFFLIYIFCLIFSFYFTFKFKMRLPLQLKMHY
jgi:hypothetical protein